MARIISIVNQKGGTGKSACTANLAVGLAQKNMKVLIVDADPQSDVSAGFGYRDCDDSNETLTALMDAVMKDEDIPSECFIRHQAEGIDIICYKDGRIDRDSYKQRAEKISVQLDEIKRKIEDAKNSKKLLEQNELSDKIKLKDFLGIQKFDTEKLREVIKVIRVHSQDEIEIEWNFDDIFSEQR